MLHILKNPEVSSVVFIRDYLQIFFEGQRANGVLTTYSFPSSIIDGKIFNPSIGGYRDSLCSFINHQVKNMEIINKEKIIIIFDNDNRLEVPLKERKQGAYESAMLRIDNQISVW